MKNLNRLLFLIVIIFIYPSVTSAQKISSYSLGEGHNEFTNSTKAEAIQLKINGGKMNLSDIYNQQLSDPNSLMKQLTERGAFAWGNYNYYINDLQKRVANKVIWIPQNNPNIISVIPPDNAIDMETWYREAKYIYKCLELYSDLIKKKNNIAFDEKIEQDSLNVLYELLTDNIVSSEKNEINKQLEKVINETNLLIDKWNRLNKENDVTKIDISFKVFNNEILKLKSQMQNEIKQLPVKNFINNKAEIIVRYDNIIKGRQTAFTQKIKLQKISAVQEQKVRVEELNKLERAIKEGRIKVENLQIIISEIKQNRIAEFPPRPPLNPKYKRLNEIAENSYNVAFNSLVY
jgi:hypothetical protein